MRISDWSSDVCSSDLGLANRETGQRRASAAGGRRRLLLRTQLVDIQTGAVEGLVAVGLSAHHVRRQWGGGQLVLVAVVVLADEDRAAVGRLDFHLWLVDRVAVDLVELLQAQLDFG